MAEEVLMVRCQFGHTRALDKGEMATVCPECGAPEFSAFAKEILPAVVTIDEAQEDEF